MHSIYFARHGETVWNVENKICGMTDSPLTEKGRQQARELGQKVKESGVHIDEILYSPLSRAADTAKAVAAATGLPAGLGSPMLDTVEGRLSSLLFGVPAVKGVEFGAGFAFAALRGSHANDAIYQEAGTVKTETNNNGGVNGGITNGMPLVFRVCIKPTPSISSLQQTLNLQTGRVEPLSIHGRHDPCIVTRAGPVVEAACAVALADLLREANGYA